MTTASSMEHSHGGEGEGHAHPPYVAHHFETSKQQFEAGKLGIWLFLITEVLFFGGLFCTYAVYRSNHPEVFRYAHQYLDVTMGTINTAVLLFSSLTMALGVRAAQRGENKKLAVFLALTILCAFGFMGIKYVEYAHKVHDGLLWGRNYAPKEPPPHGGSGIFGVPIPHAVALPEGAAEAAAMAPGGSLHNVHIFFGIYFAMTGLHGLHVLIGIGLLFWILLRALKGEFHGDYFGPVDYTGLYWHLVDLIWIYLFPLLYLIH